MCVAGAAHRAAMQAKPRVVAVGPRLLLAWQAEYTEPAGRAAARLSHGRRNTQSLLEELRRAWSPLGRGCLSHGRRNTQSLLEELRRASRVAGAVHRTSWRSCSARGRRWAAAAFRVAGAAHRASCSARCRRWAAAAFRLAGAAHRAARRSCGARGRRWAWAAFRVAARQSCGARGRRWAAAASRVAGAVHTLSLSLGWCILLVLQLFRFRYALSWRCRQGLELSKSSLAVTFFEWDWCVDHI